MTDSIVIRVLDMKKEHLKQKRQHRDCLKCDKIPCINFYRQANKLEGGEIYFLEETIKEKLITPCLSGCLIYPMCQLIVPLYEGKISTYLLYHQCIRDLRASAFLLLTGHYRSSMQILRPVLENWFTGVYFDTKYHHSLNENEKERERVVEEYNDFLAGNFKITEKEWEETFGSTKGKSKWLGQRFLLRFMLKENLISREDNAQLKKKVKVLNKYLHPDFKSTDVGRPSCPSCPSSVKFDEKEYKDCAELFQYITTFFLETIYEYIKNFFPKNLNDEKIKDALLYLKILPDLEKIIDRKIIFSKKLKDFISLLPELEPEDKSKLEGYYFHK